METKVKNNQTIVDIAIQETGSAEGLFELLKLNDRTDLELTSGTVLKVPPVILPKVVDFFRNSEAQPISVGSFGLVLNASSAEIYVKAVNSIGDILTTKNVTVLDNVVLIPDTLVTLNGSDLLEFPPGPDQDIELITSQPYSVAGNVITVEAPICLPATVTVEYPDGTPINTVTVPSGGSESVIVTPPEFVRPKDWAPRPDGWEEKKGVFLLVENIGTNILYVYCDAGFDLYVNDEIYKSFANAGDSALSLIELYDFDFIPIRHEDREWLWLYFTFPEGSAISWYTNNSLLKGDISGDYPNLRLLKCYEEIINLDNIKTYTNNDHGASYRIKRETQSIHFRENMEVDNTALMLGDLSYLSNITNFPNFKHLGFEMFRGCAKKGLQIIDFRNDVDRTAGAGGFYEYLGNIKLINTSQVTNLNHCFLFSFATYIEIEDCSSITNTVNMFYIAQRIEKCLLWNMPASFTISLKLMSEKNCLKLIDSLKDLSGHTSETIIIADAPHLNITSIIDALALKNWMVGFI